MRPSSTGPVSWDPFGVDTFGAHPSEDSMFGREFDQLQRGSGSGESGNWHIVIWMSLH